MKRSLISLASRDASRTMMRGQHTATRMAIVQMKKDKYCMVSHTCGIKKKKRKNKTTKTDPQKQKPQGWLSERKMTGTG